MIRRKKEPGNFSVCSNDNSSVMAADLDMIRYSILDPSGNITALVESAVDIPQQPSAAAALMRMHTEVEQVGFVTYEPAEEGTDSVPVKLRMAGGEFCGNASMCAAVLYAIRNAPVDPPAEISLSVSGTAQPVKVSLRQVGVDSFQTAISMPPALGITYESFSAGNMTGILPVVRMEGISHIIITSDSAYFPLKTDRTAAEEALRTWCGELSAESLGLMFYDRESRFLTPLVFVPGSGTIFWENSCASGSAATAMLLAAEIHAPISLTFHEPGGSLSVTSDPDKKETRLYGKTGLVSSNLIPRTGICGI